jgi:hypothetical protein
VAGVAEVSYFIDIIKQSPSYTSATFATFVSTIIVEEF